MPQPWEVDWANPAQSAEPRAKGPWDQDWEAPAPEPDPGYWGDIGRGLKHGAMVSAPEAVGKAAQFFGMDDIGQKIVDWAHSNENPGMLESAAGRANESAWSVRGNVYEAADNSVLSLAPGAAGAAVGATIGSVVPVVGTGLGALLGYAAGSIASLPVFYGSQGQETSEKVYKAQIAAGKTPEEARAAANTAGHLSGSIEAGGEVVQDVIPFGKLAKPFAKAGTKMAGNLVKDLFFPGLKEGAKTLAKIEAGEVSTEMAQQAGESAVEGAYGAGPGATWDETKRVIVPTALMSLIPGGAGTIAHHMKLSSDAKALANAETDPETRTKIALGATSVLQEADPELARAFAKYAGERIQSGAPIELGQDALYAGQKVHEDAMHELGDADTLDEAIAAANKAVNAPVPNSRTPEGMVDELGLPGFDFQTSFPEPKPEAGIAPDQVAPAHGEMADVLRAALEQNEPETYTRALEAYSQAFGETAAVELDHAVRRGALPQAIETAQNAADGTPLQTAQPAEGARPLERPEPAQALAPARGDETGRNEGAGVQPAGPVRSARPQVSPEDAERVQVADDLAAGKPVAPEVLAKYPTLAELERVKSVLKGKTEQPKPGDVEDFVNARTSEVKTFKSERAAGLYLAQRSNRVPGNFKPRETDDGWVLSRQVRVRTEAQKANDRKLARERAQINPAKDKLGRMIGKLGGIKADELLRDGVDKASLKDFRSGVVGKPAYRTKGGLSLDALAEILDEYGFNLKDELGSIDASKLRELIQQEIDGTDVYTPEGHERQAALSAEARETEEKLRRQNDFRDDELAEAGYYDLSESGQDAVSQAFEDDLDAKIDRLWNGEGKAIGDDDPLFGNLEKDEGTAARRTGEGDERHQEAAPREEGQGLEGAARREQDVGGRTASQPREPEPGTKDSAPPAETPAKAGVSLSDIPPALLKRITVPVEQFHDGEGVKTVQLPADQALKDLDGEISAYEKLLTCVRAA